MGREFYQSARTKVLFDAFYSIEVANFMLKVGIDSYLPDTAASLTDPDGEIFLQPNRPVSTQQKNKGTIQIFFYNKIKNLDSFNGRFNGPLALLSHF